jgi:hypothetical protein
MPLTKKCRCVGRRQWECWTACCPRCTHGRRMNTCVVIGPALESGDDLCCVRAWCGGGGDKLLPVVRSLLGVDAGNGASTSFKVESATGAK